MKHYDVIVIGAGFGGLAAALSLAQQKKKVLLLEKLTYAGGCAGTFQKKGFYFEAGATLCAGMNDDQLFGRWNQQYELGLEAEDLDPALMFYSPKTAMTIPQNKKDLIQILCQMTSHSKEAEQLTLFFEYQSKVSEALWAILNDPNQLPSFTLLKTTLQYLPKAKGLLGLLLPNLGVSLLDVLKRFHLNAFPPLLTYLNGLCQITLQCSAEQADANFALAVMDYYFNGAKHIKGGIGTLAQGITQAIKIEGGDFKLGYGVKRIEQKDKRWEVYARDEVFSATYMIGNFLPTTASTLTGIALKKPFQQRVQRVQQAWSACLWYMVFEHEQCPKAKHWEMVADPSLPFIEGNHIFCSFGHIQERQGKYYQSVTISTHLSADKYASATDQATLVAEIQSKMLSTFDRYAEVKSHTAVLKYPASPRTIARFTGRQNGAVGGIPRYKGIKHYFDFFKTQECYTGFYLVGDSFFPGQSTLACALGGIRVAQHISSLINKSKH